MMRIVHLIALLICPSASYSPCQPALGCQLVAGRSLATSLSPARRSRMVTCQEPSPGRRLADDQEATVKRAEQTSELIANVFFFSRAIVELAVDGAKASNTEKAEKAKVKEAEKDAAALRRSSAEKDAAAVAAAAAADAAAADAAAADAAAADAAADAAAAAAAAETAANAARVEADTKEQQQQQQQQMRPAANVSPEATVAALVEALNEDLARDSLDLKLGSVSLRIASARAFGVNATLVDAAQQKYDRALKLQAAQVTARKAS